MKKILCVIVLTLAAVLGGNGVQGETASLYDYPNVAVLPYANKAAVSRELTMGDASLVSEFVIEQLLDTERFNVIEREMMEAIMKEHSFNMSGMVDPMTAVQIGKLAGVRYLVAGSVTGLSTKKSGASYSDSAWGGGGFNKNTVIANVTARFIDVETGRIVLAASGTGESASTNMEFTLRKTKLEDYDDGSNDAGGVYDNSSGYSSYPTYDTSGTYGDGGNYDTSEEVVPVNGAEDTAEPVEDIVYDEEVTEYACGDNSVYDRQPIAGGWGRYLAPGLYYGKDTAIMPMATRQVTRERKVVIGTQAFSQVQVRNALYKAVGDLIYNKNFGILAKMDGKAKRRKV